MAVPRNGMMDGDDDDDEGALFVEDETPPDLRELANAAKVGDIETLRDVIGYTAHSLDTPCEDGDTGLHLSCLYGNLECVQLLLDSGASLEAKDEDGAIPLHDACASGYLDIAQLLISKADSQCLKRMLETVDVEGDTPLHHAARGEHKEIVQLLLSNGASPIVTNVFGKTPRDLPEANTEVSAVLDAAIRAWAAG